MGTPSDMLLQTGHWVYPLKRLLQNLAWGRDTKVRTLLPDFTVVALKYASQTRN